jgi:uncharacterized protein YkwD
MYMAKAIKKVMRKKKPAKAQKPIQARYPFTIMITIAALLLSLFVIISASQKNQDTRSRAQLANCNPTIAEIGLDAKEQEMLQLINAYRQANGASPLQTNVSLNRMAAWMSKDMDRLKYLNHIDSVGRNPNQRASECESPFHAENLGQGPTTQGVLDWWKASEMHKRNILDPKYTLIGIANTGEYWATEFAVEDTPIDPQPTTAPTTAAPTNSPTSPVPSPGCLGACATPNPTTSIPTVTTAISESPSETPNPTEDPQTSPSVEPTPDDGTPNPGGGGGGIIELFLGFLKLILEFFASLFK